MKGGDDTKKLASILNYVIGGAISLGLLVLVGFIIALLLNMIVPIILAGNLVWWHGIVIVAVFAVFVAIGKLTSKLFDEKYEGK